MLDSILFSSLSSASVTGLSGRPSLSAHSDFNQSAHLLPRPCSIRSDRCLVSYLVDDKSQHYNCLYKSSHQMIDCNQKTPCSTHTGLPATGEGETCDGGRYGRYLKCTARGADRIQFNDGTPRHPTPPSPSLWEELIRQEFDGQAIIATGTLLTSLGQVVGCRAEYQHGTPACWARICNVSTWEVLSMWVFLWSHRVWIKPL